MSDSFDILMKQVENLMCTEDKNLQQDPNSPQNQTPTMLTNQNQIPAPPINQTQTPINQNQAYIQNALLGDWAHSEEDNQGDTLTGTSSDTQPKENLEVQSQVQSFNAQPLDTFSSDNDMGGLSMEDIMGIGADVKEDVFDTCTYCGGSGLGMKGELICPECKKKYEPPTEDIAEYPVNISVPARYKGNIWDKEKALENPQTKYLPLEKANHYVYWVQLLEHILTSAQNNEVFSGSYLISGPDGLGKHIWLFSVLRALHKNHVKTSPIFFLNEIDVYSANLGQYKTMFIQVTKFNLATHIDKLDYILQRRKLLGYPTFVITSIPYEALVSPVDQSLLHFDDVISL